MKQVDRGAAGKLRGRRRSAIVAAALAAAGIAFLYDAGAGGGSAAAASPALSQASESTAAAQPQPHPLESDSYYKYCTRCHGAGKMKPFPDSHLGYSEASCLNCHSKEAAVQTNRLDEETQPPASAEPIPHSIEDAAYRDCAMCHNTRGEKPFPADHARLVMEGCIGCHKPGPPPQGGESGGLEAPSGHAEPIPHSIEDAAYRNCTMCHGAGKMKPFPPNHLNYSMENCTDCHAGPARGGLR